MDVEGIRTSLEKNKIFFEIIAYLCVPIGLILTFNVNLLGWYNSLFLEQKLTIWFLAFGILIYLYLKTFYKSKTT
jgi:hypothetical protein